MNNINFSDLHKPETLIAVDELKILPGIDTLYYFYSTLPGYQEFFKDLELKALGAEQQIDEMRQIGLTPDRNTKILMDVIDTNMLYMGKGEGFSVVC